MNRLDIVKARLRGKVKTLTVTETDLLKGIPGDPHNCPGALAASRLFDTPRDRLVIGHEGISITRLGYHPSSMHWERGVTYDMWLPADPSRWSQLLSAIDHPGRAPITAQFLIKPFLFVKST